MGIDNFQKVGAGGLLLMQIWHMWQMACRRLFELNLQKLVCFLVTATALLMPWSKSWAQTGDEWDWAYEPQEVELGFDFEFYGQSFNKVYITENGTIQFSNPQAIKTPTCLPASQNNALYVFWDDFRTDYENGGYFSPLMYEVQGEAPNRRFIAEWASLSLWIRTK